jgi:heat shock protein HtpX
MPFSFIEIEEHKSWQIGFVFAGLVMFYFVGASLLIIVTHYFFICNGRSYESLCGFSLLQPKIFIYTFLVALVAAILHWTYSIYESIPRLLKIMRAAPPDLEDTYHKQLQNIIDEVCVAVGGRKIDCVVLPTSALNAFSMADFSGKAVIGVTEGLLTRLNRAQLEAVVGHEAGHIIMGDTLIETATVSTVSVFTGLNHFLGEALRGSRSSRSERGGGVILLVLVLYLVTLVLKFLTYLISMFISRECEYRADAVAVRLVRDPLSLAQALRKITSRWRGGGDIYDSLESLFIVSPNYSALDEQEGFFADLFSTHPPVMQRLKILLNMAHTDINTLDASVKETEAVRPVTPAMTKITQPRWLAAIDGKWSGPFSANELFAMAVAPDIFVRREGSDKMSLLSTDQDLADFFREHAGAKNANGCPRCLKPLAQALYEGVPVNDCDNCGGALVEDVKMPRIIIRQEQGFSEEVVRQAKLIQADAQKGFLSMPKFHHELACPKCGQVMVRHFYSYVYPVEVDTCYSCDITWYDKDELEIIQYLIESVESTL